MILYENINHDIYISYWIHTKWLVLSSSFYMIPAIYALINNLYYYFVLLFFTSFISANYWRKATYSWRRNIDLIYAKFTFLVFALNCIYYNIPRYYVIPLYIGVITFLYLYYLSEKLFKLKQNNWYKYHFMFHFISSCVQLIIIDNIAKIRF